MATNQPNKDSLQDGGEVVGDGENPLFNRRELLLGAALGAAGAGVTTERLLADGALNKYLNSFSISTAATAQRQSHLPAVNSNGEGFTVAFTVASTEGNGEVFVNLENVEVRHNIQSAIKEAAATATEITGVSLKDRELHVSFNPPGNGTHTLWGKSWEAGLTTALIGLLSRRHLVDDTLVTGVISPEGDLLPIGKVEAKAVAARQFGANKLLVPSGQEESVPGIRVESAATVTELMQHVLR